MQTATPDTGMQVRVVTPLKECLDQLPPEDIADIRQNYLKPYQECQRRLADLRHKKATAGEKEPAAAVTPRNFIRVQPDAGAEPLHKAEKPAARSGNDEKPAPAPSVRQDYNN